MFKVFFKYLFPICVCAWKTGGKVVSSLQCFLFSSFFFHSVFSIFFKQKQILEKYRNKYRKHIRKKTFRLETTLPAKNWFPFMNCYYCIFFKQKQTLEKTGKYRTNIGNHTRKKPSGPKPPFRLRFTVLLEFLPKTNYFTRIEHTVQQWDAGSLHECKQ